MLIKICTSVFNSELISRIRLGKEFDGHDYRDVLYIDMNNGRTHFEYVESRKVGQHILVDIAEKVFR